MKIKLIGFVGLPGSGKSTALEAVVDMGHLIIMGDVIRDAVKAQGLPYNAENIAASARKLRNDYGDTVVAERCVEKINQLASKYPEDDQLLVFIDGLRSDKEYNLFKAHHDISIIFLDCPESIRYQRLSNRGREDDSQEIEKARKRDEMEIGFGILNIKQDADFLVDASKPAEDVKFACRQIVESLD